MIVFGIYFVLMYCCLFENDKMGIVVVNLGKLKRNGFVKSKY